MRKKITIHMPKKADEDREYFAVWSCAVPADTNPIRKILDELDKYKHCTYTIRLLQCYGLGDKAVWIFTLDVTPEYRTYFTAWFKDMFNGRVNLVDISTINED